MTENGPKWRRPKRKENIVKVLKKLRDAKLGRFIYELDRAYPYVFTFDDQQPDRPILIEWDGPPERTAKWSEDYGCIGQVCQIHERKLVAGSKTTISHAIGMVQLGGAIIERTRTGELSEEYECIPTGIMLEGSRKKAVLIPLTIDYFLSTHAILEYSRTIGPRREEVTKYIRNDRAQWHTVDQRVWEEVCDRLGKVYLPSESKLKELREKDTDGITDDTGDAGGD